MRNIRLILIASIVAAASAGCTSSSDNGTGGAGGGPHPPWVPPTNGVAIDEGAACDSLVAAISNEASKLQCVVTVDTCPNYIRKSAPECSQYDEGSVLGCADFFATYTSCDDFANRPCEIHYIANSAPSGCPADDAGVDATDNDAQEIDAQDIDATDTDVMDTDAGTPDAEPDAEDGATSSDDATVD